MPSMENFYYICDYLKVTPKDFFDDGTQAPKLLAELIEKGRKLDRTALKNLLKFIRNSKK